MKLYVCKNAKHKNQDGEVLLQRVLNDYLHVENMKIEIKRTEYGKPYAENANVHFSVSHTDDIWSCLVADSNVGADIQTDRKVNFNGIAKRFFSQEEADYVECNGPAEFFQLWTRKEAYVKYTGRGFSKEGFAEPSFVEKGQLVECIGQDEGAAYFQDLSHQLTMLGVDFNGKLYAAICTEKKESISYQII